MHSVVLLPLFVMLSQASRPCLLEQNILKGAVLCHILGTCHFDQHKGMKGRKRFQERPTYSNAAISPKSPTMACLIRKWFRPVKHHNNAQKIVCVCVSDGFSKFVNSAKACMEQLTWQDNLLTDMIFQAFFLQ